VMGQDAVAALQRAPASNCSFAERLCQTPSSKRD
jgi:hypothetical protein